MTAQAALHSYNSGDRSLALEGSIRGLKVFLRRVRRRSRRERGMRSL